MLPEAPSRQLYLLCNQQSSRGQEIIDDESLENKLLEIIKEETRKKGGAIQSELWRALGVDSREGSKLVAKLIRRGLVSREAVTYKGKKTYILRYTDASKVPVNISVNLNPVIEVPCFTCRNISKCNMGGYYDPVKCSMLTRYLLQLLSRTASR